MNWWLRKHQMKTCIQQIFYRSTEPKTAHAYFMFWSEYWPLTFLGFDSSNLWLQAYWFLRKMKKKLTRKQLVPILKRYLLFVFIPLHNFSIKVLHIYLVSILLRQHSRSSICIWFLSLVHRSYTRILYVDIMYIVYSTENVKSIVKFEPTLNS